ncbi:MAG TPA: hypothetical protein QF353_00990 [Gammaproteobacteria bacterium]|nr:hypothetical protein [Gammaproteobacteria bacterium]
MKMFKRLPKYSYADFETKASTSTNLKDFSKWMENCEPSTFEVARIMNNSRPEFLFASQFGKDTLDKLSVWLKFCSNHQMNLDIKSYHTIIDHCLKDDKKFTFLQRYLTVVCKLGLVSNINQADSQGITPAVKLSKAGASHEIINLLNQGKISSPRDLRQYEGSSCRSR